MAAPDNLTREQLNLIYNNIHDLVFLIGVEEDDYRVLSVNRAYLEHTGANENDIVNLSIAQALGESQAAYVRSQYDHAVALGGPYNYETRTQLRGNTIYLNTTLVPVLDDEGNCQWLIGVSRDSTRKKLERKKLEEARDRAEKYLDIAEAVIVAFDDNARITMLNAKGYEVLGYEPGSLIGADWCELCVAPEKHALFRKNWDEAMRTGVVGRSVSYVRTRSGEQRLLSWASTLIRDEQGEITGALSSGEDITDQRRAEKAIIASQRQLAAGEVAAAVAHDFNNALQGIMGNIEIALASPGLPQRVRSLLGAASGLADDAAERLRVLQRFTSPERASANETLDVNAIAEEVIEQTRHMWRDEAQRHGKSISITRQLVPGLQPSRGSRSELRSALYNIMKNAIEAIAGDGEIHIETSLEGADNVLIVRDTGVGMAPDVAARVFQPFFSTKGLESGRGLGMSASLNILRSHGGDISVRESVVGTGTTIAVRLPTAAESLPQAAVERDDASIRKHHILWVDDDHDVRELAAGYIDALGHTGDVAADGNEALALVRQHDYSIVITDVGMAGMNGFELAQRLQTGRSSPLPVIAITGWGESVMAEGEIPEGVTSVLAKPIRLAELKRVLDEFDP